VLSRGRTQLNAKFNLNRKTADGRVSECSKPGTIDHELNHSFCVSLPRDVKFTIYFHVIDSGQCS
jgi:hypothetical protein